MELDAALDRLFGVPLEEFTDTRNQIAKELSAAGAAGDAKTVKALKKPPVSAWAVNRLTRERRALVDELVAAGEAIETADDTDDLRAATQRRKRAISELLSAARSILEGAGHNASATTLDRISNSLLAATTEEARGALRVGRLTQDLAPSGLEAWGLSVTAEVSDDQDVDGAKRRRAEELARAAEDAERAARDARRALDEARAGLERAEKDLAKAVERAERARAAADDALADL